jgi:hypothetical protein
VTNSNDPIWNQTHDAVELQLHLFLTLGTMVIFASQLLDSGKSDPVTYWEESGWAPEFFLTLSRREKSFKSFTLSGNGSMNPWWCSS